MATNHTYSAAAALPKYLSQIGLGAGKTFDDADVTALIAEAAAELNGALLSLGVDLDAINADTSGVAHLNCRRLVCYLALPDVVVAYFDVDGHQGASSLRKRAERWLERVEDNPSILGISSDDETGGGVNTTVQILDLDTSAEKRRERNRWRRDDTTRKYEDW